MRLWHKNLIEALPRQQLISQWRECCAIARNISVNGTPNHLLVNKVLDYPLDHFYTYAFDVYMELRKRGFMASFNSLTKWISKDEVHLTVPDIFPNWHTDRYLLQCFYNLQEKYDCGGISEEEWQKVNDQVKRLMGDKHES